MKMPSHKELVAWLWTAKARCPDHEDEIRTCLVDIQNFSMLERAFAGDEQALEKVTGAYNRARKLQFDLLQLDEIDAVYRYRRDQR